ncbi:PP2C family protein-serine/threonine phosphatase [Nocardioides panaciterrulae]|uniref:GAF domain-containing protein n=1 Tax=Nocardioides panaciterrulae TaxID=661492 RepID=A0A7Y9JAD1_9ACTN|nr:SpoIIE family protein phosphatase [Nocardioides panaciterrulae]NYD41680.1 hypothetical protein [Nocardioides panaciterrulae]
MTQAATGDLGRGSADEERRQRTVTALGLIEDGPQERFDRIARLATTIFGVPMAAITVFDGDRAWFPGQHGFASGPVPRDRTLCERTVVEGRLIVCDDTRLDPRFRDKEGVREGRVVFYAGHPLRDRSGTIIGTLCIYDDRPRHLTDDQVTALGDLASWAERELRSEAEMSAAGAVQSAMLPPGDLEVDGWHVAGICRPALAVGGDFYDYGVAHGTLHVGMGDVMGKGTGAALVGAGARAALRGTHAAVTAGADLGVTITHVARSLLPDLERAESFVTLFEAAVDLEDGLIRYVDAGMGLALLRHADGTLERLVGRDRPLGVLPDDHWTEHEAELGPGDRMIVFSDGLLDLLDDPDTWLDAVAELLAGHDTATALLAVVASLTEDRVALDDVTVVAVYRAAR